MYTAICLWVFQWVNGVVTRSFRRRSTGNLYTTYLQSQDTRENREPRLQALSRPDTTTGLIATEAVNLPFKIHTHTPEAHKYQQLSRFSFSTAVYRDLSCHSSSSQVDP